MSKAKRTTGPRKRTNKHDNDIFKKYAAPWSANFLYFDQLQHDFAKVKEK